MKHLVSGLILCLLGTSALAQEPLTMAVDAEFTTGTVGWKYGGNDVPKTGYIYKWRAVAIDKQMSVCGIGYFTDRRTRQLSENLMKTATVNFRRRQLLEDLSFFAVAKTPAELQGGTANCRKSERRSQRNWTLDLRFPTLEN